jgi:hypothetical protein
MVNGSTSTAVNPHSNTRKAKGAEPVSATGDKVRVCGRFPVGHHRVPLPIRGKPCRIEAIIAPPGFNSLRSANGHASISSHALRNEGS